MFLAPYYSVFIRTEILDKNSMSKHLCNLFRKIVLPIPCYFIHFIWVTKEGFLQRG